MSVTVDRVLMGIYFYPRGGSAHVCRSIARELGADGIEVTLLAGSRSDLGEAALAEGFYDEIDLRTVDFTPAVRSADPLRYRGPAGTAPIHGSYEDRPGAEDPVLASLDEEAFELQARAWTAALAAAAPPGIDALYLHHLTPLNEAAARVLPEVPVVGHVHGTELLMLERIEAGPPPGWACAAEWGRRLHRWAAACKRIVVNDRGGLQRAACLLGLEEEHFACVPNGFDGDFAPGPIDRRAHWRRHLVERPLGWRPGGGPGSVSYAERDLGALDGTVLLAVGRFTAVKRLPLLIEAFAEVEAELAEPAALVLIGGHPGEWEGEHPYEAIRRSGARNVFLAGWHAHEELPAFLRAGDLLVHASVREQFGQVLIEAMACGLPAIAVDRGGPAAIVEDPETGWLVPPDDRDALAAAISAAIGDGYERRLRGERARQEATSRYSWPRIGKELAGVVRGSVACALLALALLLLPAGGVAQARSLYWGAWIGPQLTGSEPPWDMAAARRFEATVHHGLSLLEFSSPFASCGGRRCSFYPFPTQEMEKIRRHGAIPLFSWNSGASGRDGAFRLADLRRGRYDAYIRRFARAAKAWGHPFFLRFDWEMNGDWFPWGAGTNGNRPGQFRAAWRHVHDVFRRVGANNATWVWCPYARDEPLRRFYPGGRYVDWTCLDGYNWGPNAPEPAPWRSFREIFAPAYRRITGSIAPGKPMLIAEVASSGAAAAKADWVRGMFGALRGGFAKIHGLAWFDKVDRGVDWPLETSAAVTQAFARGLDHGYEGNAFARIHRSPIPPPRR
ncbi:MAG: glycosyltransferase [Solirubrobacterales bacterium]